MWHMAGVADNNASSFETKINQGSIRRDSRFGRHLNRIPRVSHFVILLHSVLFFSLGLLLVLARSTLTFLLLLLLHLLLLFFPVIRNLSRRRRGEILLRGSYAGPKNKLLFPRKTPAPAVTASKGRELRAGPRARTRNGRRASCRAYAVAPTGRGDLGPAAVAGGIGGLLRFGSFLECLGFGGGEALRFALFKTLAFAELDAFADTLAADAYRVLGTDPEEWWGPGGGLQDEDVAVRFWVEALAGEAPVGGERVDECTEWGFGGLEAYGSLSGADC